MSINQSWQPQQSHTPDLPILPVHRAGSQLLSGHHPKSFFKVSMKVESGHDPCDHGVDSQRTSWLTGNSWCPFSNVSPKCWEKVIFLRHFYQCSLLMLTLCSNKDSNKVITLPLCSPYRLITKTVPKSTEFCVVKCWKCSFRHFEYPFSTQKKRSLAPTRTNNTACE